MSPRDENIRITQKNLKWKHTIIDYGVIVMTFTKSNMTPYEAKMNEYRTALLINQQSVIEYIAVMADIPLPTSVDDGMEMSL